MKGLVRFAGGAGNLEIREIAEPLVQAGQIKRKVEVAKTHGVFVIISGTSVDTEDLKLAQKLGADRIIGVTKEDFLEVVKVLASDGHGVDVVLECSGSGRATAAGIEAIREQEQFIQIGLADKYLGQICCKEIKVISSHGSVWTAWKHAIRLVKTKQLNLKNLVSHEVKLKKRKKGFEIFENNAA